MKKPAKKVIVAFVSLAISIVAAVGIMLATFSKLFKAKKSR